MYRSNRTLATFVCSLVAASFVAAGDEVEAGEHGASPAPSSLPGTACCSGESVRTGPVQASCSDCWGGWPSATRGWSSTNSSSCAGYAEALGHEFSQFNPSSSGMTIRWDDVVFSSASNTTISVSLNGFLLGSFAGTDLLVWDHNQVHVGVQGGGGLPGAGSWNNLGGGSGMLSGYDGQGPFNFTTANFDVPTNTPTTISLNVSCWAITVVAFQSAWTRQTVSLGSSSGSPLGTGVVFNVPAGVTVNSAEAGIVDNGLVADAGIYLGSNPQTVDPGDELNLVTWNCNPGSLALMFVTGVNGSPILVNTGLSGLIDLDGRWALDITVPLWFTGYDVEFSGISFNTLGKIRFTNPHTVTFQ